MDGKELVKQTLDQIPQANSNAKRIVGLVKEGGRITGYQLSDNSIVEKQQAVNMAKQGQIAGVGIAHRGNTEYLKSMKKYVFEFVKRGLMAASGGPVILAIVYGIIGASGEAASFTPSEVCMGILTVTLMAFIAAGITIIYQMERLPLASAIAIHAGVLYLDYLLMYLLNSWIPRDWTGIGIFTAIFFVGYALVWVCIYFSIKAKTDYINRKLRGEAK